MQPRFIPDTCGTKQLSNRAVKISIYLSIYLSARDFTGYHPGILSVTSGEAHDAMADVEQGTGVLSIRELLTDAAFAESPLWWSNLPIVGRARGRWVFSDVALPGSGLAGSLPRQRARRTLDASGVINVQLPAGMDGVERHNKSSINTIAEGPHLDQWKEFALKSTNQALNYVPKPPMVNADQVWLRVMSRSHGALFRPGALKILEDWQKNGASTRQKEAFSELMWSLTDHMTAKRGRTETKIAYGPKQATPVKINLIDPFASSLGKPSGAPIVHAVQLKAEARKRSEIAAQAALAEEYKRRQKGPAGSKDKIETFKSDIPFKWPGADMYFNQPTSSQRQDRTVTMRDRQLSMERNPKSEASCPPASYFMRTCGAQEWHGQAKYPQMMPTAMASFDYAVDDIPRTQAYHRMQRYVL